MKQFVLNSLLLLTFIQEEPSFNVFSLDQDIEIGTESAKEADKSLLLVRDAAITDYFREMGLRLARNSPLPTLKYRFKIINSRDGDAVTFPGGAIYIDRGLIELTANENELAAILAHEIAHAAARHGTAQLSRQLFVLSPASIVAGLPTREGWKDQLAHLGISFGAQAPFLRYSESQEIEANAIAVEVLAKSGYSPYALSDILNRINSQRADKTGLPAYAYHHPQGERASDRLEAELHRQKAPPRALKPGPPFRGFQASLARLTMPVNNPPATNANTVLTNLYEHPGYYYRLSYPEGWQVTQRDTNGAIIAPPGGIQASRIGGLNGESTRMVDNVGTGVIFGLFDIGHPMPLEQATERLIVHWNQNNQSPRDPSAGYRVIPGAQRQIPMGAEPALRTIMIGRPSSTQPTEIVWLVTRLYYQSLFYILCVAPEGEEFDKSQPIFEQIIRSVELRER